MSAPTLTDVQMYLQDPSWSETVLEQVLAAEKAAQAARCRVPTVDSDQWPADLIEALLRRVATNLANRNLPLGVSSSLSEAAVSTVRVGGLDREVRRLEAPHRKLVIG